LDDLQCKIAKSHGWRFNAGGIPSVEKSMSISGTYCPDNIDLENEKLEDIQAFTLYIHTFFNDLVFDSKINATKRQVDIMKKEVLVVDLFELCHDSHIKQTDRKKRQIKYGKEHAKAASDLHATVDALFFQPYNTHHFPVSHPSIE
jgi:hypothetical protein